MCSSHGYVTEFGVERMVEGRKLIEEMARQIPDTMDSALARVALREFIADRIALDHIVSIMVVSEVGILSLDVT